MSINLNLQIQKKDLWLLAAIVVFLVGVGYVIAYGGNQPSVHGHSAGEIEGGIIYDSGWFSVNTNQIYNKTHNLGSKYLFVEVFFAPDSGGIPDESNVYRVTNIYTDSGQYNGASIKMISDNQLRIKTGQSYVYKDVQGGIGFLASGWYRVIAKRN